MKNKKTYILKLACSKLQELKRNERTYKRALIKNACSKLIKYAETVTSKLYDDASDSEKKWYANEKGWNDWYRTSLLGKLMSGLFGAKADQSALGWYLTSDDRFDGDPEKMKEYLIENGITDPDTIKSYIATAQKQLSENYDDLQATAYRTKDKYGKRRRAKHEKLREEYERSRRAMIEDGFLDPDDYEYRRYSRRDTSRDPLSYFEDYNRRYLDGPVSGPHRQDYLTDEAFLRDNAFARNMYGDIPGRPTTINNYYYTSSGIPVPASTPDPDSTLNSIININKKIDKDSDMSGLSGAVITPTFDLPTSIDLTPDDKGIGNKPPFTAYGIDPNALKAIGSTASVISPTIGRIIDNPTTQGMVSRWNTAAGDINKVMEDNPDTLDNIVDVGRTISSTIGNIRGSSGSKPIGAASY